MSSSELQRLERTIHDLESHRALLGDAVTDAALGPLRSRLAALRGGPTGQHPVQILKHVTVLFTDVVGSTSLAQHLDAEEVSAVMDGVLSRGTAVVEAHRGKVVQYAGDSILAVFGADRAAEDDAERAVRCGLALLDLGKMLRAEVQAAHARGPADLENAFAAMAKESIDALAVIEDVALIASFKRIAELAVKHTLPGGPECPLDCVADESGQP